MRDALLADLIVFGIPLTPICVINLIMALRWRGKTTRLMLARVMFLGNAAAFGLSWLWFVSNSRANPPSEWGLEGLGLYFEAVALVVFLVIVFLLIASWILNGMRKSRDTRGHAFVMDFSIAAVLLAVAVVLMERLLGGG